jgi:hypothetical protein
MEKLLHCDRAPQVQDIEERRETAQLRVALLRESAVDSFPVKLGFIG